MASSANSLKIVIFGDGAIAELAHYYFTTDSPHEVVAFTVDGEYHKQEALFELPVIPFEMAVEDFPPDDYALFIALGYGRLNRTRQEKFEMAKAHGYGLASYIASHAYVADNVQVGENCFILENQTVQPFCTIDDNVTLWSGNHIGHHSSIGAHTFVASHVVISGRCVIGRRCFLGVNATLIDGCALGDDVFIAMDTSVVSDVPSGGVAIGAAGRVFTSDDRQARILKRKYFQV